MTNNKVSKHGSLEEESRQYKRRVSWIDEPYGPNQELGADLKVLLNLEPGSEDEIEGEVGHLEDMVTNGFENGLANNGNRRNYERVTEGLATILAKFGMLSEVGSDQGTLKTYTLDELDKVAELCGIEPVGAKLKGSKWFSFVARSMNLLQFPSNEELEHDFMVLSEFLERVLRSDLPFEFDDEDYVNQGYFGEKKDYIGGLDQFLESAAETKAELEAGIEKLRERIRLLDECSELAKETRARHLQDLEDFE